MKRQKTIPILNAFPLVKEKRAARMAFTLVELIVVITILAILGTIAFISLQGYSSQSRDSVRISDMSRMKTGLELFQLDAGKYPIPTDGTEITYSGGVIWTQGYFGDSTYKNVGKLDKIPLDPLTDKKYVYSTTNTRQEFQIAGVMEGDEISFNQNVVNAGIKTALVKISGNYNGKLLKISTGSVDYVLAIPSILTNTGKTDIVEIVANDNLSYNGYKNLPYQYDGGKYNLNADAGINLMNAASLVVYSSGSLKDLSSSETVGINARKTLLENLQNAYTGTTIKNLGAIARILSTDTTNTGTTELLMSNIVSNNLGGSIVAGSNGGGDDTPVATSKTVADCLTTGTVIYGTLDGTDTLLTCEDDIIVCSGDSTGYTISACNAGATTLYTDQSFPDTLDGSTLDSISIDPRTIEVNEWAGGLYQWGNNADLSITGSIATTISISNTGSTYDDDSYFRMGTADWNSNTDQLVKDEMWGKSSLDLVDKRGPCPVDYHVPSEPEWFNLTNLKWEPGNLGNSMITDLKLPTAGGRGWSDASMEGQAAYGFYWSTTPNSIYGYIMRFQSTNIDSKFNGERAFGASVRCFKN